jgi:calpain
LAALANLAENKKLFYKVVPPDQDFEKNYAGIFRFRFWR